MKTKKRVILYVIMSILMTSCSKTTEETPYQMGLDARTAYTNMTMATGKLQLTADYGERVYPFDMVVNIRKEEGQFHTEVSLTAPAEIAGISATQVGFGQESKLIWGDMILETGDLSETGLSPVNAMPLLIETLCQGYLDTIRLVEPQGQSLLELCSRNPEATPGTGQEITIWLDPVSFAFLGGEIFQEGQRVIACEMTDFIMS